MTPEIDVVIALHNLARPIERAVASARSEVSRVTVVCHGISAEPVAERLHEAGALGEDVRLVEFADGHRSPSGPFNHGMRIATADLITIMGSDDWYEPGALAAWLAAAKDGADVVLGPLRHQSGEPVRAPLARPLRRRALDPVRDRVSYRTAPLALFRRRLLDDLGLELVPERPSGGDLEFGIRLWTGARRLDLARRAPAYVIGADARDRTTGAVRPIAVEMAPLVHLLGRDWFRDLPVATRRAVAIKLLRVHVLDGVARRQDHTWTTEDAARLAATVDLLCKTAPDIEEPFSVADRAVLDAARSGAPDTLIAAARARTSAGRWAQLRTRRWRDTLDRESTLRRYGVYALSR
ncbi:glycosyltransferase family 2 protein [Cellulosimicrobium cellulans]|uniref:glycosyltransferase family 2 protein n=1 Tax=Cellulosimicrobium cellulans TaxID=1710 RepID=UPI0008485CB6|nr:glycosyltransferase [Cellulosimicrobium cellulans]